MAQSGHGVLHRTCPLLNAELMNTSNRSYKISRRFERSRNLGQRGLLSFAYWHAADAKESTFFRSFCDMLTNLLQPALVGGRIARCFGIDNCRSFPQRFNAL